MPPLIDEETKAEAARFFLNAAKKRVADLAVTPFGRALKDCVSESNRIRNEENREPTTSDFAKCLLEFMAKEGDKPNGGKPNGGGSSSKPSGGGK